MEITTKQGEQYWIDEFRNGTEAGLRYFFDQYYKSLCYFAVRLVQDDQEAEDIVANCFVKLSEKHKEFDTDQNIKSFLYAICRNACLNYLKHLRIKSAAQTFFLNQAEQGEEIILNQIIKAEVFDILNQEIEFLPEKCREIFKLIYFEHKKTDEIAEELALSVQTVRNQKTKAIELLKNSMIKRGLSRSLFLVFLLFIEGY